MKSILKYRVIIPIIVILLIVNIVPLFIFPEQANITKYSYYSIFIMTVIVLNGIRACVGKHNDNYFIIRKRTFDFLFSSEEAYTHTDEYEKEFRWMLLVYFAAIPFYIPVIFFAKNLSHLLWSVLIFALPQTIYFASSVFDLSKDIKKAKKRRYERQKEREEQEKREELGRWK